MMKRYREVAVFMDNVEMPYIITETEDILYQSFPLNKDNPEYVNFLERIEDFEKIED